LDPVENNARALSRKFKLRLVTVRGVLKIKAIEDRMDKAGFSEWRAGMDYSKQKDIEKFNPFTPEDSDDTLSESGTEMDRMHEEGDWDTSNRAFDDLYGDGQRFSSWGNEDTTDFDEEFTHGDGFRWDHDLEEYIIDEDSDYEGGEAVEGWRERHGSEPITFHHNENAAQVATYLAQYDKVPESLMKLMKQNAESDDPVRPAYEKKPHTSELDMKRTVSRVQYDLVMGSGKGEQFSAWIAKELAPEDERKEIFDQMEKKDESMRLNMDAEDLAEEVCEESEEFEEFGVGEESEPEIRDLPTKTVVKDEQVFKLVDRRNFKEFKEGLEEFEALDIEVQRKLFRLSLMNYYSSDQYWQFYSEDKEFDKLEDIRQRLLEFTLPTMYEDDIDKHDAINDWAPRKYDLPKADVRLVDDGDYDQLYSEDRRIFNRFASRAEKLEEIEKEQAGRDGHIGQGDAPPKVDLLSQDVQSPNHYNIVMLDISDGKNDNYSVAVRDTAGRLRGPFPKEFARVKELEKGYQYARFNYLKWEPLDKHHKLPEWGSRA